MTSTTKYRADRPPTMGSEKQSSGSFVPRRCPAQELGEIPNVMEMEQWACAHAMAPSMRDFVNYGAEDEESKKANRRGFSRYALRPRILNDVSQVQLSTTILQGRVSLSFPLCISPFAGCSSIYPQGELEISKAAAQAGIVYSVPHWGGVPLPDLVNASQEKAPLFFQMYPLKPQHDGEGFYREHVAAIVEYLASFSGRFVALIVTSDTVNNGNREKTYKNRQWLRQVDEQVGGFATPQTLQHADGIPSVANPSHTQSMTWDDIRWLKQTCQTFGLALILKGVMTGEMARKAAKMGVDAVIVSNHGGRQLDSTLGTIEVVEECVQAARGTPMEIFVDGGIRRGKDIVKCMALGAKCVFVGRPILWGLAAGGQEGVSRVLDILKEEARTVLELLGCSSVEALTRDHIFDRHDLRVRSPWIDDHHRWILTVAVCSIAAFALGRYSSRPPPSL